MKITGIETVQYRIPLPKTLSDSTYTSISSFDLLLVSLHTDAGISGLGYTKSIADAAAIKAMIDRVLAPLLLHQDPLAIDSLWSQMYWRAHSLGRSGVTTLARAACDLALWDLKGKQTGLSLCRLLGGEPKPIMTYAGGIDLYFSTEELVEEMQQFLARGFRAVKMKVGRSDWREDIRRVAAVRKAIGDDVPLLTDANLQWSVAHAIQAGKAMEEYGVYWLEEPTHPDDVAGHRLIADAIRIPLALGESLYSKWEFQRYLEARAVHFPEPDVIHIGGVTEWMKVATLAQAYNRPVTSHGYDEIHVHLLAAVPSPSFVEYHLFRIDDYLCEPLPLVEGCLQAPDRPGHGVVFDLEKLKPLRIA
ncbi:MAG: mandelate racemase/muconate lactonizing enzyme family protein [Nitrospinota bacterium]|nr:MAG: mandelate racemase/muconate lactonizing enzyme family protein [Nitrospinota bacterium]